MSLCQLNAMSVKKDTVRLYSNANSLMLIESKVSSVDA